MFPIMKLHPSYYLKCPTCEQRLHWGLLDGTYTVQCAAEDCDRFTMPATGPTLMAAMDAFCRRYAPPTLVKP